MDLDEIIAFVRKFNRVLGDTEAVRNAIILGFILMGVWKFFLPWLQALFEGIGDPAAFGVLWFIFIALACIFVWRRFRGIRTLNEDVTRSLDVIEEIAKRANLSPMERTQIYRELIWRHARSLDLTIDTREQIDTAIRQAISGQDGPI